MATCTSSEMETGDMESSAAAAAATLENFDQRFSQMEELMKNLLDQHEARCFRLFENMNREIKATQDMVVEMLGEVRSARSDCQNNYQTLASKFNESTSVFVVEDSGSITQLSSAQNPSQTPPLPESSQEPARNTGVGPALELLSGVVENSERLPVNTPNQSTVTIQSGNPPTVEAAATKSGVRKGILPNILKGKSQTGGKGSNIHSTHDTNGMLPGVTSMGQNDIHQHDADSTLMAGGHVIANRKNSALLKGSVLPTLTGRSPPFLCAYCPRRFEHNHSITLHLRSCKKRHDETLNKQKQANQQQSTELSIYHKDDQLPQNFPVVGGTVSLKRRAEKMIRCGYCERSFPTQHQVTSHERVHTGDRPFSCYICGVNFAHGGNMIKHIKSKHPKHNPYVCRYCNGNFKTHLEVLNHRKVCAPPRRTSRNRQSSGNTPSPSYPNDSSRGGRESEGTITASEDEGNSQDRPTIQPTKSNAPTPKVEGEPGLLPMLKFETERDETPTTSSTLTETPSAMSMNSTDAGENKNMDQSNDSVPILKEVTVPDYQPDSETLGIPTALPNYGIVDIKQEDVQPD